MIEVYSLNVAVDSQSAIPLNNVTIKKGCTAINSSPSTIQLNKAGVYMLSCNASATPDEAGLVSIQLYKNGVAQPQAVSSFTGTVGDTNTLSFTTLVQVSEDNTCCCCDSPTMLQILNVGGDATFDINVAVTKIC